MPGATLAARVARLLIGSLLLLAGCGLEAPLADMTARLSCGTAARFDLGDLRGALAEPASDQPGVALATFLGSIDASTAKLPLTGWRRVAETPDAVLFLAESDGPDVPFAMVELQRNEGNWKPTTWGGCLPRYMSDVAQAATWGLEAPLDRNATALSLLVDDPNCARFGGSLTEILRPRVDYDEANVVVTIWASRDADNGAARPCPANPSIRYSLDLKQSVGNRVLLDGGVVPPQIAGISRPFEDPGDASPGPDPR